MSTVEWQAKLEEWLQTNPKTIPPKLEQLRQEFVNRFPPDRLTDLTLETYALGLDSSTDSFCYWLEYRTEELGSVKGGSANKWGIYWSKSKGDWVFNKVFASPQDAIQRLSHGLQTVIDTAKAGRFDELEEVGANLLGQNRYGLRQKPLNLYFPDEFLPIVNKGHLINFLNIFGAETTGDIVSLNRRLLATLQGQPEFAGIDPQQMKTFLYGCLSPWEEDAQVFGNPDRLQARLDEFAAFYQSELYEPHEREYKDEVLGSLGSALREAMSAEPPTFVAELQEALTAQRESINNLTNWIAADNFSKMLKGADAQAITELFSQLLDGSRDVDQRMKVFKNAVDDAYLTLLPEPDGNRRRRLHNGLMTLFLAAYDPEQYMIYRSDPIVTACRDFGMTSPSQKDDWYSSLMTWAEPVRKALHERLESDIDWVDVHSFLWVNHRRTGDYRKLLTQVLGQDPSMDEQPHETDLYIPAELSSLHDLANRTRNIILYGPPGTGKTWLVNHFATYRLLRQNLSPAAAADYWNAVTGGDHATAQQLRNKVRAEPLTDQRYWWVTVNPGHWSWQQLAHEASVFFQTGRIQRNFPQVQVGDYVFGYSSSPDSRLVALAEVSADLHLDVADGHEQEGITLVPLQAFTTPLSWSELMDNPILNQSEPLRNGARGTLFALTTAEVAELHKLLTDRGNEVPGSAPTGGRYVETITFHQSMAYEDFIEGLRPVAREGEQGGIDYQVLPGILQQIARKATAAWLTYREEADAYILLIDEINRANIAKVFGELITLLEDDKRLGQPNEMTAILPYSRSEFGIPPNLMVIGTMNTADRSIALLDIALRRRFMFLDIMPDPNLLDDKEVEGIPLGQLLHTLNQQIRHLIDDDHQIGHSYFMDVNSLDDLQHVWYRRIVPLLQEYFYRDGDRLRRVIGAAFVQQGNVDETGESFWQESANDNGAAYTIAELTGQELANALQALLV